MSFTPAHSFSCASSPATDPPPIGRRCTLRWVAAPVLIMAAVLMSSACSNRQLAINDPYEEANRAIYLNAQSTDNRISKPLARFYRDNVGQNLQNGIGNFIANIDTTNDMVNNLLQLRFHRFFADSARLLINSSVGLLGLIDVAQHLGVPREKNDFGKTMARWGWRESAVVILPRTGIITIRDFTGLFLEYVFIHPIQLLNFSLPERLYYELFKAIDARVNLLPVDHVLESSGILDPYAFSLQNYRESRIVFIKRQGSQIDSEVIWTDEELELFD